VEIYSNACNKPELTPIFTAQATRVDSLPGTLVYNGQTLRAYKLVFCDPPWTLSGGQTYWLSTGATSGGSLSGVSLFACNAPDCTGRRCDTRLNPGSS